MTPRGPSSAQNDTGLQRLPFAAAEALLWGPEMKKQHQWLLQQMRELNTQHEAYDARIQTTEAIAEAAEAATARIRHMEQHIIAMEAVDKENRFENWAMAEINQLKAFRDDNKNVRLKQIEFDKEMAGFADGVDKVKHVPIDLANLVLRVDILGSRQKEDADCIKKLEREIAHLKSGRQASITLQSSIQPVPQRRSSYQHAMTPPRRVPLRAADDNSETEDENMFIRLRKNEQPIFEKVKVPRSPGIEEALNEVLGPPSTMVSPMRSARQRLFKRPSIHDSKLPRLLKEIQRQDDAVQPGPPARAAPLAPVTQIVDRSSPKKHKQPIDNAVIPPKTRTQAGSPEKVKEQPTSSRQNMKASEQQTQLVIRRPANLRKRVRAVDTSTSSTIDEDMSKLPTQLVATSPRKKPRVTSPARPDKKAYVALPPVGPAISSPQKQLIVVLQTPKDVQIKKSDFDDIQQSAAEGVKTSPRKSVVKIRSCIPCRQRHVACDKAQPVCGPCSKLSRSGACAYPLSHQAITQSYKPTSTESPKRVVQDSAIAGPSRKDKTANITQRLPGRAVSPRKKEVQSTELAGTIGMKKGVRAVRKVPASALRSASPEEPTASLRPREAKTRAAAAISTTATRSARRAIRDTRDLDYDTFLKMKKENPKF